MNPILIPRGESLPCLMFIAGDELDGFRDAEKPSHILVWRFREDGRECAAVVQFLLN